MTFRSATKPARGLDDVDEVPDTIPRGRGRRPKIRRLLPDGSDGACDDLVDYTRASTLGKTLRYQGALHEWQLGNVAWAMGRRVDYQERAAAVATSTDPDDKRELADLVRLAIEYAGGTAGATRGTALHRLSDRLEREGAERLAYLGRAQLAALLAYRDVMATFTIHALEQFVVWDDAGAAGTYDRLVSPRGVLTTPDGTRYGPGDRLIWDTKTSSTDEYFGPEFAVQAAVYAHGRPYGHLAGRGEWPDGIAPSKQHGLIGWFPLEDPERSRLKVVDLSRGAWLAHAANDHREACKTKDLITDIELPNLDPPPSLDVIREIAAARSECELDATWRRHRARWTAECSAAAARAMTGLRGGD